MNNGILTSVKEQINTVKRFSVDTVQLYFLSAGDKHETAIEISRLCVATSVGNSVYSLVSPVFKNCFKLLFKVYVSI